MHRKKDYNITCKAKGGHKMVSKRIYAEINLDNLRHNMDIIRKKANTQVMAIVKADAYGHGAVEISRELNRIGIFAFGVATAQEALELKENGIQGNILVIGYVFEEHYPELISRDTELTVFDIETAKAVNEAAEKLGKTAKIHIKVDTGMGRIGFLPDEKSIEDIVEISKLKNIFIQGIFTHFARADEKDKTSALKQAEIFSGFINSLEEKGIKIPIKHMCNSAGTLGDEFDKLDMVRSGIITYGLAPSEDVDIKKLSLRPLMKIVSHIVNIKKVPSGFPVSYGSTYITDKETVIATVPAGYGDGYPRSLSNRGKVLINGEFAPIIGRICMDQFMVDVTNIKNVKRGTAVTLVGSDGQNSITVEELSEISGRFNYEFVCDINKRVERIYVGGSK